LIELFVLIEVRPNAFFPGN